MNKIFFNLLMFLVSIILIVIIDFYLWFIMYKIKGFKLPKNISTYKKPSFFKRLLIDLPRQFWLDRFKRKPRRI